MGKLFYLFKKMLGLSSLMFAFIAIFTPIFTIYLVWFSIFMAGFAGLTGSLVFSSIAFLVNFVNLFFLSPISLALIGGNFFSMITTLLIFIVSINMWSVGFKLKLSAILEEPKEKSDSKIR